MKYRLDAHKMSGLVFRSAVFVLVVVVVVPLVCVDAGPVNQLQATDSPEKLARGIVSQSTLDVLGLRNSLKPSEEVLLRTKSVECNQSSQCFPPDVDNAPTNLIDCDRNQCLCKQCFERGPNGICEESDCEDYYYSNERRECVDHRKSQTTAFLLSFFLSSVGAANFYIEQNAMGVGQLLLVLLLIAAAYTMCCVPFCVSTCLAKDDVIGGVIFIVVGMTTVLMMLACLLGMWAWWLADLIIFGSNERDAGNGCSLKADL